MPVRELIGWSGVFIAGPLLLAWGKVRLWEWQRERGL